uniref:Pyridine nucleotide-disulfide oxidoreductase domain-containing protein 2 n=1 Tax=Panagrolaimus sp. JU765 TaxID=591449 RepID=A0AC34Q5I8_9BILA
MTTRVPRFPKTKLIADVKERYDAIIVGGGHNGLTAAAYLAKAGKKVAVFEKRHVLGGAAVTEEIIPGFRFSRASYLLSLFRPQIIQDLDLKKHGLKYHIPYPVYEKRLEDLVKSIEPLIDLPPFNQDDGTLKTIKTLAKVYQKGEISRKVSIQQILVRPIKMENVRDLYKLFTAPISKIMDQWFESDVLKATLATDGVIGFAASPYDLGTGYVLFHHVLGGLDGIPGVWAIVYGGMGSVSAALAKAADSLGVEMFVESEVNSVLIDNDQALGIQIGNKQIFADMVFSNLTPHVTFNSLIPKTLVKDELKKDLNNVDYTSPVCKINVALNELPNFTSVPNTNKNTVMPHHQATIHLNCENMGIIDSGFRDFQQGAWSKRPVIELTIPSSIDRSIVDKENTHVGLIFTQYTPYNLADNQKWDEANKKKYAEQVFSQIDEYAPNFSKSVVGYEVLPPPELEKIFNLTGGV